MDEIVKDQSTGFIPEEELLALAGMPAGLETGAESGAWCVVVETIVSLSQAFGDGCPTTACTSRCGRTL
jgi:hypothetical protein